MKTAEAVKGSGIKVIGISHQYGQKEKGEWKVEEKYKRELEALGAAITAQSHLFSGIESSITKVRRLFPSRSDLRYSQVSLWERLQGSH